MEEKSKWEHVKNKQYCTLKLKIINYYFKYMWPKIPIKMHICGQTNLISVNKKGIFSGKCMSL